jgi:hypothetical protein
MYPCGNDMHKFVLTKPMLDHENFVHCGVTEGASRNARMGKTRKEAIEIPKPDN